MTVLLAIAGALLIVLGALAYAGRWRNWASTGRLYTYALGFGLLFGGIGVELIVIGGLISVPIAALVLLVLGALFCVVLIISFFTFPKALLPRWFRETHLRVPR